MFYDKELTSNVFWNNLSTHERRYFRYRIYTTPNKYFQGRTLTKSQKKLIRDDIWLMKCKKPNCDTYHAEWKENWCEGCHVGNNPFNFIRRKKVKTDNVTCSICTNTIQMRTKMAILPCNHSYHITCIRRWFEYNVNCPCCRTEFFYTSK